MFFDLMLLYVYVISSLYSPSHPIYYSICHLLMCASHFTRFLYFMLISRALLTLSMSSISLGKIVNLNVLILTGRAAACSLFVVTVVPIYIHLHGIAFKLFLGLTSVFLIMCGSMFGYGYSILAWYVSLTTGIVSYLYYNKFFFITEIIGISAIVIFCGKYVQIYKRVLPNFTVTGAISLIIFIIHEMILRIYPTRKLQCFVDLVH